MADRPNPPYAYQARQWAEEGAIVECFSGRDPSDVVHEGRIIGMTEAPTVRVQKDDGQIISWVLGITRKKELVEQSAPVVDTDLRSRIAEVARDVTGSTTGSQSYAPIYWDDVAAEIYERVVAPVLAERDAEIDRLKLDIQGYQVGGGYERGHEHGFAESAKLRAELDELRAHGVARDIGQANDELRAELDLALWLHAEAGYERDKLYAQLESGKPAGDFRTGGHWGVTVIHDPDRGEKTGELWATAQRPEWAVAIVGALNQRAEPAHTYERTADDGSNQVRGGRVLDPSVHDVRRDEDVRPARGGSESAGRRTEDRVGQPDTEATAEEPPFCRGQHVRQENGGTFTVGHVEKSGTDWKVYNAHTVFAFYTWASNLELADAVPVDTEATEQAEPRSDVVVLPDNWEDIVETHSTYVDGRCGCGAPCPDRDALARHREAVFSPATPTEPRVWRKGDPEPPEGIQVLVDCKDEHLPYLCRIPGSRGWWQWFERPTDRHRAPGGVPWAEATAVMGSGVKDYVVALPGMTEVVEDQAGDEQL